MKVRRIERWKTMEDESWTMEDHGREFMKMNDEGRIIKIKERISEISRITGTY